MTSREVREIDKDSEAKESRYCYERIGGIVTVQAAVNYMLLKIRQTPELITLFKEPDQLQETLSLFYQIILGGKTTITQSTLNMLSANSQSGDSSKSAVAILTQLTHDTLKQLGIPDVFLDRAFDGCKVYAKFLVSQPGKLEKRN